MVIFPSSSLLSSRLSRSSGGQRAITEDKYSISAPFPNHAYLVWALSTLAMSTELAQDEDDADGRDTEAYDLETIERGALVKDDDDEGGIRLHGGEESLRTPIGEDGVVFEIGDDDEEHSAHARRTASNGEWTIRMKPKD